VVRSSKMAKKKEQVIELTDLGAILIYQLTEVAKVSGRESRDALTFIDKQLRELEPVKKYIKALEANNGV